MEFSNIKYVAELATFQCYYHNVAKLDRAADGILFSLDNIGYKKMWFEYGGIVEIGIDVTKVQISEPDANGIVTITIPQAEILGLPKIDELSMSDPLIDTGWFTPITTEDKMSALGNAQSKMKEAADNDDRLKFQDRERAEGLLRQYVINIGTELGEVYEVKFIDSG